MHFGHLTRYRNPKMTPYIRGIQKGKNFINLVESLFLLEQVSRFIEQKAFQGKKFLFVGTEKQSAFLIEKIALLSNSFFVNDKWIGGLLTNWKTMKSSVNQLQYLERFNTSSYVESLPKKKAILYKKQKQRLDKYFRGLKKMVQKPEVVIIIGQRKEINAVRECRKLNISTITVLDTNCNPALADFFIPANDDSYGSLDFLFRAFLKAIRKGRTEFATSLKLKR
jgi:small subunit ribosomal protein S2